MIDFTFFLANFEHMPGWLAWYRNNRDSDLIEIPYGVVVLLY